MPLLPDEFEQVEQIARHIAKQEIEAMGKMLVADIMDLQAKIDDLEAESVKLKELEMKVKELEASTIDLKVETKKALQPAPAHVEPFKKDKRR